MSHYRKLTRTHTISIDFSFNLGYMSRKNSAAPPLHGSIGTTKILPKTKKTKAQKWPPISGAWKSINNSIIYQLCYNIPLCNLYLASTYHLDANLRCKIKQTAISCFHVPICTYTIAKRVTCTKRKWYMIIYATYINMKWKIHQHACKSTIHAHNNKQS